MLSHIEAHSSEPLDLDRLASIAATSKFPFLRIFRRAVGLTPYQFLLSTRLRRAALKLLSTPDAVSAIACESGFGDLSTFNSAFRDRFGTNPLNFRRTGPFALGRMPILAWQAYPDRHSHADSAWRGGTGRYSPCRRVKNR